MGRIEKYPLERMKDKSIELSFTCPQCMGTRIEMNHPKDISFWEGMRCPKCNSLILLDDLSVTVVKEEPKKEESKRTPSNR